MTDGSARMCNDGDAKPLEGDESYRSVWVSHWTRTSCKMETGVRRCLDLQDSRKDVVCNTTQEELLVTIEDTRNPTRLEVFVGPTNISGDSDTQRSSKDSLETVYKVPSSAKRNGTETDDSEGMIKGDIPFMNSRSLTNARSEVQSFSMFSSNSGSALAPIEKVAACDQHVAISQINENSGHGTTTIETHGPNFSPRSCRVASKTMEFTSKDTRSHFESITQNPVECAISYRALEKKSIPVSTSFRYFFPGSSSNAVQYKFKSGETPAQSLVIRNKEAQSICETASDHLLNTNLTRLEQEGCYCISPSTCSVCDRGMHLFQKMPACSVHDAETLKTCTSMDFGAGIASSTSNKDIIVGQNPVVGRATLASSKVGCRTTETELPISISQAAEYSTGKRDLITSITPNFDGEHSHSHVEQSRLKSSRSHQCVHDDHPSSRLVKRLKLSLLDSPPYDKKSFRTGARSSGEKVKGLFTKVMNYSISSSEAIINKRLLKKQKDLSKNVVMFKSMESTCINAFKEHRDETISHPWIQRWCHNEATVPWMKRAANVIYEPQMSKATTRKHLPSIAAMALMGRATNSFRPCEFRKRGPVMVWNTESKLGLCEQSQAVNTN